MWLRLLHDGGPRNKAKAEATVWGYLNRIRPILLAWSDHYDHLREVTRDDVVAALDQLHGHQRRQALVALRSLFSRARKNSTIFRDPTRGLKVGQHQYGVLQPLLSDAIDQAVEAAKTPAAQVMVALAAVHAARAADMINLLLDDVDLGNRRITIGGRLHPLDDLTHHLLSEWLRHRQDRWPDTANPHLLISHHTALTTKPASGKGVSLILHGQAATLERLRRDRILEEALACGADPLHLSSVFGFDTKTAIHYANSARALLTTAAEEQDPAHSDEPKDRNHP
jgi:integrase